MVASPRRLRSERKVDRDSQRLEAIPVCVLRKCPGVLDSVPSE
jgi:hypothetical protein